MLYEIADFQKATEKLINLLFLGIVQWLQLDLKVEHSRVNEIPTEHHLLVIVQMRKYLRNLGKFETSMTLLSSKHPTMKSIRSIDLL